MWLSWELETLPVADGFLLRNCFPLVCRSTARCFSWHTGIAPVLIFTDLNYKNCRRVYLHLEGQNIIECVCMYKRNIKPYSPCAFNMLCQSTAVMFFYSGGRKAFFPHLKKLPGIASLISEQKAKVCSLTGSCR